MDLTHDPEDDDAFQAISEQIVARFELTADGQDRGWVADQLLQFKHGYLLGDLGRWTAADLSEVLFQLYPRKVVLETTPRCWPVRPPSCASWTPRAC